MEKKSTTTTKEPWRFLPIKKRNAASKEDNEKMKSNSSERGESMTDIDTSPDSSTTASDTAANYGYEDSSPDDKATYGYEDASPPSSGNPTRVIRRSSMKQAGRPRRASIQFGGEIEVQLLGVEVPVRRRTSITFEEKIGVKEVVPIHDLTHEPEALWFQNDEYKQIKETLLAVVRKTQQGTLGDTRYCTRGLEKLLTQEAAQETREKRYMAWDSVLNEQDLQRDSGFFDDQYMANCYKVNTRKCQQEAANRASQDAVEVENYLQGTRLICRRISM